MRHTVLSLFIATCAVAGEPVVGVGEAALEAKAASESQSQSGEDVGRETTVTGQRPVDDETLVGPYHQPKWTERRRFPGTRVYVAPPGTFTFEFWSEVKVPFGEGVRIRDMAEVSIGLGHRLQLDLYLRTESNADEPMFLESERVELRWALADWGVLPGNPTLYLEWIRQTEGPNKAEVKVLFGGQLGPRLGWGLNLFFERELSGLAQGHEYGLTAGATYSVDDTLSVGAEARIEFVDTRTSRFNPLGIELLVGPALAWKPVPAAHLLVVWYLGPELTRADTMYTLGPTFVMQPTLVLGWRL